MSASEGEADFLVLRADVWKGPNPTSSAQPKQLFHPFHLKGARCLGSNWPFRHRPQCTTLVLR